MIKHYVNLGHIIIIIQRLNKLYYDLFKIKYSMKIVENVVF